MRAIIDKVLGEFIFISLLMKIIIRKDIPIKLLGTVQLIDISMGGIGFENEGSDYRLFISFPDSNINPETSIGESDFSARK